MHNENTGTNTPPLRLAAIGLGGRGRTYLGLAAARPDRYKVVAGADPDSALVQSMAEVSGNPHFRGFRDDRAILAEPKLADVMIISTQDAQHREHAIAAMERGYDILLEKPIATTMEDVLAVESAAQRLNRKVLVCHVLRYAPLYVKIKEILDSGRIGRLISMHALEGVGAFHHAHSYVRGNWADTAQSSPMILAKSCHDLDILYWLAGQPCRTVSSFGGLDYFNVKNAPEGAPERCHQGCPINQVCPYDSAHYADTQKRFLNVNAALERPGTDPKTILDWVGQSPWGRCVYRCDNDAVDHQVVNMEFEEGITASLTMTAFARGRSIELYGTAGVIRAGAFCKSNLGADIMVSDLDSFEGERISVQTVEGGYESHGGADTGIVEALYREMEHSDPAGMSTSIHGSVMSHMMAFAAEAARVEGRVRSISDFRTD